MDKFIPIWFEPTHRQGMFIPIDKGFAVGLYEYDFLKNLGIRIYEEQYIGQTYQQIIEEYVNNIWVK